MFAFLVIEVPKEKKMEGKGWCDGKNGIKWCLLQVFFGMKYTNVIKREINWKKNFFQKGII
jgi:hypothetical protein